MFSQWGKNLASREGEFDVVGLGGSSGEFREKKIRIQFWKIIPWWQLQVLDVLCQYGLKNAAVNAC